MANWKKAAATLIAWLPTNGLRCAAYRLMGHTLARGTRVGLGTVIACDHVTTGPGVIIGRNTRFTGPFTATIGRGTFIGRHNRFDCGAAAALPAKAHMHYARRLIIGEQALIHERHMFDLYGEIRIGDGTWIAGSDSQFWTHGASAMDRDIAIGSACYLGSAVRMAPGTAIPDRCVLGLGSVVVTRLDQPDSVLGGFPARRLRAIGPDDRRAFAFSMDAWNAPGEPARAA